MAGTSLFQAAKNFIVSTSCLFYPFKPFGFTEWRQSGAAGYQSWDLFLRNNPGVVAMVAVSMALSVLVALLFYFGCSRTRFLCVGLILSVAVFVPYAAGTAPRYLNLAVLFLSSLGAHVYSSAVAPRRYRVGATLVLSLLAYNLASLHFEKQPYLSEIRYLEKVRMNMVDPRRLPLPADNDAVREIRKFWGIKEPVDGR